mgnify:CR=1
MKGYWTNKHMNHVAEIISEPIVGVYELRYLNDTNKKKRRWCRRDLLEHWEPLDDDSIDEEE